MSAPPPHPPSPGDTTRRPHGWLRRRHALRAGPHPARPWHQRLRRSLHWRLVALFLLLAAATTLVFVAGVHRALDGRFGTVVQPLLADYVDRLAAEIGSPPDLQRAQALAQRLPVAIRIDGPRVQWASQPHGWNSRWHAAPPQGATATATATATGPAMNALLTRTTADGHVIRFGLDEAPWRATRRWPALLPLAGLLLLTGAAYLTVRRLFRPLDDIRAGTQRYGEGRFDTPIPVRRPDELGDLAQQVNAMAASLQAMLQGQRALLLAISHELRSPLTRARVNAELVPEGAERDALLRDLALMGRLITDLLESERLAAGSAALAREPTDLNALVADVVREHFHGQPLRLAPDPAVPLLPLDRPRVALLVRNLVDNACRHGSGAAQPVEVATRAEAGAVVLSVRDHGPGVPAGHLERLAQPFHRPDTARTRAAGGVGLGLYLCRLVMQSHGGTLVLRDATPGLEVQARWPL